MAEDDASGGTTENPAPAPAIGKLRQFVSIGSRGRGYIQGHLSHVAGLMPTLMKQRNGGYWTPEERQQVHTRLRRFAHLSPYLVILLLPGSVALLPLYAWWLDRRRKQRAALPPQLRP